MDKRNPISPQELTQESAVALFGESRISLVLTDPRLEDEPILYVNGAFETLTGYTAESAIGRNCRFLQGDGTDSKDVAAIREALAENRDIGIVLTNYRADGEAFRNALLISSVRDGETDEVTFRVGLQAELEQDSQSKALADFEALVIEMQHRVKNHLSMILSMVRMTSRDMEDGAPLVDLSRRIESLQLLYEEMSAAAANRNEDKIQLGSYLGRVGNAIAYLDGRAGVRMNIQVEPLMVETDKAVRIGLVISEVLTNAMQHAFDDQQSGLVELRVSGTDDGGIRAVVSDDGKGLPEGVTWPDGEGLGGRIVKGLCEGMEASLDVNRGAVGTVVTLEVPG